MQTLSRAMTAHLLVDTTTYLALQQRWRSLLNSERRRELSAAHHLLYLALRGKDWRKGFTPPTNPRKLANGALPGWVLFHALFQIHAKHSEPGLLAPFAGVVTPEMLARLRQVLPLPNNYACRPEQFAGGAYPFEAYTVPATFLGARAEGQPHA